MSNWHPKPLRPMGTEGIFSYENDEPVVKSQPNRWQQQRQADGSPYTRGGHSALTPPAAGPKLVLGGNNLSKAYGAIEALGGEQLGQEIYDYLCYFPSDSPLRKKAVKLLEEKLKLQQQYNEGKQADGEEYWKKCEDLRIRQKKLILEQETKHMSKGMNPDDVVKSYLEKSAELKSLTGKDECASDADDLEKNK